MMLQPIQSISMAEERTVDGKDAGLVDDTSRSGFPGASSVWLQQIRGFQQNGLQGTGVGDQQNYLRLPGSDGRMNGAAGEYLIPDATLLEALTSVLVFLVGSHSPDSRGRDSYPCNHTRCT